MSGERLFVATARLRLPPDLAPRTLRVALESLASDMMVELKLDDETDSN
jgi:glycine cleavage system regulatory protein